jgi:putative aminopeptidase FrvX
MTLSDTEPNYDGLFDWLKKLCLISGLSGYEDPVREAIAEELAADGTSMLTDTFGNLIVTVPGRRQDAPRAMIFAHTDQMGLVVRRIEEDGYLRVERLGGVPERVLPGLQVVVINEAGEEVPGVIATKAHHAVSPDEKYEVVPYEKLFIDIGVDSAEEVKALKIQIGAPVTYRPTLTRLQKHRVTGTALDDRGGCVSLMALVKALQAEPADATLVAVFSVQEEFNLRGAMVAANRVKPDCAISIDIMVASDTPDLSTRGELALGMGPSLGMYSFHGRGTLNGTLPHPVLLKHVVASAAKAGMRLQRSAHCGCLTDSSYVQLTGDGVPAIDIGYPARYTHTPIEVCDLRDIHSVAQLLEAVMRDFTPGFSFARQGPFDRYRS